MAFEELDTEQLKKELDLQKKAADQAKNNLPSPNDTQFDPPQKEISQHIVTVQENYRKVINDLLEEQEDERYNLQTQIDSTNIETLPKESMTEISTMKKQKFQLLISVFREERRSLRGLRAFKELNELRSRDAQFPDSMILHWAIIIVLVLVESIANSYFFAKGSDLGILGGVFQALLISVANIGSSILSGMIVLRHFNHINQRKKIYSFAGLILYLSWLLIINFLAAHYRAQLEINIEKAGELAVKSFLSNPLGIQVFDAWIMFSLGMVFSLTALIKSYTSDDIYPNYGRVTREYLEALKFSQEEKEKFIGDIRSVFLNYSSMLEENIQKKRKLIRSYLSSVKQTKKTIENYNQSIINLEHNCNTLLNYYRDINRSIRTDDDVPGYFKEEYKLGEHAKLKEYDFSEVKKVKDSYEKIIDDISEIRINVKDEINSNHDKSINDLDKFFNEVEKQAELSVEDESEGTVLSPKPSRVGNIIKKTIVPVLDQAKD